MKKISLVIVLLLSMSAGFSQAIKVQSASNYLRDGYLDLAKENIDAAAVHEATINKAKTHLVKGQVYLALYQVSHLTDPIKLEMTQAEVENLIGSAAYSSRKKMDDGSKATRLEYAGETYIFIKGGKVVKIIEANDGAFRPLAEGSLDIAYEAFNKCLELDPEKEFYKSTISSIAILSEQYFNLGIDSYKTEQYEKAILNFDKRIKIYKGINQADTNAALLGLNSAIQIKDTAKTVEYCLFLIQNDISNYNIHLTYANILVAQGKTEKANKIIDEIIKKDPNNLQVKMQIAQNNFDQLEKIIYVEDSATYKEILNNTAELLGSIITEDSNNFDANFLLGALYMNSAVNIKQTVNNLKFTPEDKEFKKVIKPVMNRYFDQAYIYIVKTNVLQPNDLDILNALKQLYLLRNDTENYLLIDKQIKTIEAEQPADPQDPME